MSNKTDELADIFGELFKPGVTKKSSPIGDLKKHRELREYSKFIDESDNASLLRDVLLAYDITLEQDFELSTKNEITHSKRRTLRKDLYFLVNILTTFRDAERNLKFELDAHSLQILKHMSLEMMHILFDMEYDPVDDADIEIINTIHRELTQQLEEYSIMQRVNSYNETTEVYSEEYMKNINKTDEAKFIDSLFEDLESKYRLAAQQEIQKRKLKQQATEDTELIRKSALKEPESQKNEWEDYFSDFFNEKDK
jgi:hypothetical protein